MGNIVWGCLHIKKVIGKDYYISEEVCDNTCIHHQEGQTYYQFNNLTSTPRKDTFHPLCFEHCHWTLFERSECFIWWSTKQTLT